MQRGKSPPVIPWKPMRQERPMLSFVLLMLLCFWFGLWQGQTEAMAPSAPSQNQFEGGAVEPLVKEQTQSMDTAQVEEYWNKLMQQYKGYFPDNRTPSFTDMLVPGGDGFSISSLLRGFINYFLHEILVSGKLLASIVILTVFSMLLETLQSAFEKNAVSKIGYAIAYLVLMIIAVNSFSIAIGYAKTAISGMIHFMMAMVPLLLTMLASMGSLQTVAVLHPLFVFMIHAVGTLIYVVVFPLLFLSGVLHIVSSFSDRYKVTQLANFMRTVSVGILGVLVTVFLGVLTVQGAGGAVTDGVTLRTAKYVTSNFVPVVGRMFSDATDTVIGASLLIKNAVGVAGVVILIFLCAFPAIKILTLAVIYNLSAAVLQPLGTSPIVGCLEVIGKNLIYVFAALAVVGLMFFLAITMLIAAGNVALMMR
ncbi:stage III sporulation protein AE [Paenibacillus sp. y28]|uniref:stage III sporulation protein AE n=1 Tax=Paenibacillus sp. y28 TaxID=3129110 RepID=UPI003015F3F6